MQDWRPFAFWASCSCDNEVLIEKVKAVNAGTEQDKEVIRRSTIKEYGTLTVDDYHAFNVWLLEQEKVSYKAVVGKLAALQHHRWAYWHIMGDDNPRVDQSCSMPPHTPPPLVYLGPLDLALSSLALVWPLGRE